MGGIGRNEIDFWCEKGILWLVTGALVFAALATGAVRPQDFLVVQGLTMAAVLLWLLRIWVQPSHRLLWPPVAWAVCAFMVYALWSYGQAPIEHVARDELVKTLVYGALFIVILDNLHRQEAIQTVAFTLLAVAAAVSLYAIYQLLTDSPRVWHFIKPPQYNGRGTGTFICPNHLAGFLEMLLPIGLAFTLASRLKPTAKVFLGYASLMIMAGLVASLSRGGWLASGASLALFFGFLLRSRSSRLPALAFLILVLGGGYFFLKDARDPQKRLERIVVTPSDGEIRFALWPPAVTIWREHFWFGAGPGHYDHYFRQHRPAYIQWRPVRAHNDYLNTLADWGTTGAALVAAAFAAVFFGVVRSWKFIRRSNDLSSKPSNRSAFVLGGSIGLVAILLHSVVDFNMHIPANAMVAVSLMAFVSCYLRYASERFWVNLRWAGRAAVTLIGVAWIAYLGAVGATEVAEQTHLVRADAALHAGLSQPALEELQAAFRADPMNAETAYRVGELLRLRSWDGGADADALAERAIEWFKRAMELNPLDPWPPLRAAMCLDWLGKPAESEAFYERALELDPRSYYVAAVIGWRHYFNKDYIKAKRWLMRSHELKYKNEIMMDYLPLVEQKILELGLNEETPEAAPE